MFLFYVITGLVLFGLARLMSLFPPLEQKYLLKSRLWGPWPEGPCIWFHGASMGECKMLLGLAKIVARDYPECPRILITTQKKEVLRFLRAQGNTFDFAMAPADTLFSMRAFMDRAQPLALVLGENEIWPGYLWAMNKLRGDGSVAIVSGRCRKRFVCLAPTAVGFLCAQTAGDLARIQSSLGKKCSESVVGGNWKNLPWAVSSNFSALKRDLSIDTVFLSVHYSEWLAVKRFVLQNVSRRESVVLFPRRLEEAELFCKSLRSAGVEVCDWPRACAGMVTVVRKFGLTREALSKARRAVVGGSFQGRLGVHDFWEPLLMGVPTSVGPYVRGQEETANRLIRHGMLSQVKNPMDFAASAPAPEEFEDFLACERGVLLRSYEQFLHFLRELNQEAEL